MILFRCVFDFDVKKGKVKLRWFYPRPTSPRLSVAAVDEVSFTICTAIYHFKRISNRRSEQQKGHAIGYVHLTSKILDDFSFKLDHQPKAIGDADGTSENPYTYDYDFPGHFDCISKFEDEIIEFDALPGPLNELLMKLMDYVNEHGLFIEHENLQILTEPECRV